MQTNNRVQIAGLIGMAGAVLWAIVNILEVSFGLFPPGGSGPLYVANQLMAFAALAAVAVGILGISWGGGVSGRVGKTGVWLFALGHLLIILGGIMALFTGSDDSPIFIVFPLGGLMMDVGALLTGIAVVTAGRWSGWQRYMPLIYAVYLWLAIEIPGIVGIYADGPTFWPEIFQDIGLFLVALAVYTAQRQTLSLQSSAAE
jgi:hypothetical protein